MAIVVHQHAINSIIAILNLIMCKIPVRLLHFIYVSTFGIFYACITLMLHGMGKQSTFYGVLDWESHMGMSAAICLGVAFILSPICHFVSYLFCMGRDKVAEKIIQNQVDGKSNTVLESRSELLVVGPSKESIL